MSVNAYAAKAAKAALEKFNYDLGNLGPNEIEVAITHCGICHSDVHLVDNDWGISTYPLVPGHEIVGTIANIGSDVAHLKKGQRVGIGWQCGSCMACEWCLGGKQNLCAKELPVCVGRYGGFADRVKVDGRFAFALPETLTSANAAPLLCAGATVYSPLSNYGVKSNMRVGIIGIGGLGHLAVQFAHAMGCEVTAFSSSKDKENDVKKLGADNFASSVDVNEMKKLNTHFDFILSTVHVDLNWPTMIDMLRPYGQLCVVGIPPKPLEVPVFPLIIGNRSVCGSNIGNIETINEMLKFAARHNIQAQIEIEPMHNANAALERVRKDKARFRIVLEN